MNNNIATLILIILISSSCTDDEKKFVEMIELTRESKVNLLKSNTFPSLDLDNLAYLKKYSDSINKGDHLFEEVLKSKKSIKRVKKYLLNNTDLKLLCSSLFLEEVDFFELKDQCNEGYFNICPQSFSDYKKKTEGITRRIRDLVGEDVFSSSDCTNFLNEEV